MPISDAADKLRQQINDTAPVPTKNYIDFSEESFIPQGIEVPKPELVFALGDIPLFTKKSISVLKGMAKAGKTTVTAWITAQTIHQDINVLWIDTEQGLYYGSRTQFWVLQIAGVERSEYLRFYDLKIYSPTVRIEIVNYLIDQYKPDLVIIDGIRDLVFDINNPEEATTIAGDLMRWAEVHDCHILNIIHENKGNGNARGHLGTELINKSETVIKVYKSEDGQTVCEPEFTRGMPFEVFAFVRDSYGIPQLSTYKQKITTGESNSRKLGPTDMTPDQHNEVLKAAFNGAEILSYSELLNDLSAAFVGIGTSLGMVKLKTFISYYTQHKYLVKEEKTSNKTYYSLYKV